MARFVVLENGDEGSARDLAAGFGGPLVAGWDGPAPPGAVRVGAVTDATGAAQAVLAAVRGCDLVVLGTGERAVIDQLCDDLRRLGELDHRVGPGGEAGPVLSEDERALLACLMAGQSLGEAARTLHLSRRTADRRVAAARQKLRAATTSEAVIAARRIGVTAAE